MRIKTVKAALNRLLDNKPVYFSDGFKYGQIDQLTICDGGESYKVILKNGYDSSRGRMTIDGTSYLFTDKSDIY